MIKLIFLLILVLVDVLAIDERPKSHLKVVKHEQRKFYHHNPEDGYQNIKQHADSNYILPETSYPLHYNLHITSNIHRDEFNFNGRVAIKLAILENTNKITMHSKNLTITSINLFNPDNTPITISHELTEYDFLVITTQDVILVPENEYRVEIVYNGEYMSSSNGFYSASYINAKNEKV